MLLAALVLAAPIGSTAPPALPDAGMPAPPMILERLGAHRRPVATDSEEARRWFDQGLALMNGYNFDGAIASFMEATRHDPDFPMAWWGIAYASGPNQNNPAIVPPKDQWSHAAAKKAFDLRDRERGANRALIEALVSRYEYPMPEDLTRQNEAYLAEMRKVAEAYPFDPDVQTWTAEAMITLQPWAYWSPDGEPLDRTPEFRAILERVMRQDPRHPGANHLYIHAMESSPWPELAEPAADRLIDLIPASGHLVHMPSHIWMQTGRYDDAAECNRRAAALDDQWFEGDPNAGEYRIYMSHNRHFLAWAATMQGRRREAVTAARAIWNEVPAPLMESLAAATDGIASCKWHALVRFGMWEDILAEPVDPDWAKVNHCLRHYARGVAFANTDRIDEARAEVVAFDEAVESLDGLERWMGNQPAAEIMPLARLVLLGEIEYKAGDRELGLDLLKRACEAEEAIVYAEPAPWMMPARHAYGALLVSDGRHAEAEKVYLRDLEVYPANGWALLGLREALRGQGRDEEAMRVDQSFRRAWESADVMPPASCYCGTPVASR